jgi:hypothetical protein
VTYSATNVRRIELVLGETLSAEGGENTEPENCKHYKGYLWAEDFSSEKSVLSSFLIKKILTPDDGHIGRNMQ